MKSKERIKIRKVLGPDQKQQMSSSTAVLQYFSVQSGTEEQPLNHDPSATSVSRVHVFGLDGFGQPQGGGEGDDKVTDEPECQGVNNAGGHHDAARV